MMLDREALAVALGKHPHTIDRWIRDGDLTVQPDGRVDYDEAACLADEKRAKRAAKLKRGAKLRRNDPIEPEGTDERKQNHE